MAFDFSTLVTDRTQQDVAYAKQLAEKLVTGTATEEEKAEWNSFTLKGVYNHTDLNRVTTALEVLKAKLESYGYLVPGYEKVKITHPTFGGGSNLPDDYIELEYIQSTGTQYIDTGFKPNQNSRVVMDVQMTAVSSTQFAFCSRGGSSDGYNNPFGVLFSSTTVRSDFGTSRVSLGGIGSTNRVTIDKNKTVCTVGSNSVTNDANTFQSVYNLFLLASPEGGTPAYFAKAKLYSCQIYDNGTLVRDFVPCINPNGEVGLYDLVTASFFGNAGTGTFTAGNVVETTPTATTMEESDLDPYTWYEFDWPTPETMTVYLRNVSIIRSVLAVLAPTPEVPDNMVGLMVKEANDIEVILLDVYTQINIMATTFIPCGEALCGGDNL